MSGTSSLTILSEEQKFNGDNLLNGTPILLNYLNLKDYWDILMEKITKPDPESIQLPTFKITQPISTAIYSSNPTFDEWVFQ